MSVGWWIVAGIALVAVLYIGRAVAIAVDDLRWLRATRRKKRQP